MKFTDFVNEAEATLLNVENMEQKIILVTEMTGQVSDGMWENSGPRNHWKWVGHVNDRSVGINHSKPGVFRHAPIYINRRYNFANKELLDIVGDRIMIKINLWKLYGDKVLSALFGMDSSFPDDIRDFDAMIKYAKSGDKYYVDKFNKLKMYGITREMMEAAVHGPYKRSDLNRDCRALGKAIQAWAD